MNLIKIKNIPSLILTLLATCLYAQSQPYLNVIDFGAIGDGQSMDRAAIQRAIDECADAGGTIYFPPGTYLSGSLELHSNITLHISSGAILLGSTNIADYKAYQPDEPSYNDAFLRHSLLYAENVNNITITGRGTIDGQGGSFVVTTKKKPDRYKNRPFVIRFVKCQNVLVENIRMQNSAMWMQQYFACHDLTIRGINVYNHCNKNNDMIDIDGCKNVVISDCFGDTDDDALTIKSTSGHISENITVTNCILSSHCNAIKLGTESHGGFKDIVISNVVVKPSAHPTKIYGYLTGISGITLGMVDGGILDGVQISNIRIDGPRVPIYMRLGDRGRTYKEGQEKPDVGIFRNVMISDVIATGADTTGCSITGLTDKKIENVTLENINICFMGGGKVYPEDKKVPELRDHYPESTKFGALPTYGFYLRHISGLSMTNINLRYQTDDQRSAIIAENVDDLDIFNLRAMSGTVNKLLLQFKNVRNAYISGSRALNQSDFFVSVSGAASDNIILNNNFSNNISNMVLRNKDVMEGTVLYNSDN
jgi:hypothetical protein